MFQARTNLIKKVSEGNFVIDEAEGLAQHSEVMRTVLIKKEELEINALEMGTNRLGNLTEIFNDFRKNGTVENPTMMATGLC